MTRRAELWNWVADALGLLGLLALMWALLAMRHGMDAAILDLTGRAPASMGAP